MCLMLWLLGLRLMWLGVCLLGVWFLILLTLVGATRPLGAPILLFVVGCPGMPVSVAGGVVIGAFFVLTWGRVRGWTTLLLSLLSVGGMVGCFTGMLLLCTVAGRLVVLGRVTGMLCGLLSLAR